MIRCCGNCRFSKALELDDSHECRRHAPVVQFVSHVYDTREKVPAWPIMHLMDWCGDWEQSGGNKGVGG